MTDVTRQMRVIILDDNPHDRELVIHELNDLYPHAEIFEPGNMKLFEAVLDGGVPNLVVTDLHLGWSDGRETFAMVKARHPNCPVVMYTGTGNEMIAVELMKSGLDDYVVKSPRHMPRLRASLKLAAEAAFSRSALTEREAQLMAMVAHKDTILRELHHRVNNNLQIMISLLLMRSNEVDGVTRAHFDEIAGRVHALAAVQSRIYESEALDQVDFGAALFDIAERLAGVYQHERVAFDYTLEEPIMLEVERAMPLGLLCWELILNTLKHAWPHAPRGVLTIALGTQDGRTWVRIADDGVGFCEDSITTGLGTRLIRGLAREARVEVATRSRPGGGTSVTLQLT